MCAQTVSHTTDQRYLSKVLKGQIRLSILGHIVRTPHKGLLLQYAHENGHRCEIVDDRTGIPVQLHHGGTKGG